MAAAALPAPGTKFGPCEGSCEHVDCARTRADVAKACVICGEPIGYERRFYVLDDRGAAHASCAEDEAERRHAGRAQ